MKKEQARERDLRLINELNEQMKYKSVTREREQKQNAEYIKMVILQDEKEKKNQKDADYKAKQKRMDVRNFQLMQISNLPGADNTVSSGGARHFSPNGYLDTRTGKMGEGMSLEEIRLNKQLLQKISHHKKTQSMAESKSMQSYKTIS